MDTRESKESGLSLFKHEKSETGSNWQLEIPLPAGLTVTPRVGKKLSGANQPHVQEIPGQDQIDSTPTPVEKEKIKSWFTSQPNVLFAVCILIYLVVRLIGLTDYPSSFTADEVNATTAAFDLFRDGFHGHNGELLPTFFPNPEGRYGFGLTVYIQLFSMLLFGRSDYVIRATSVLVGLIGAVSLSLALRNIFRVRYWWAGILVLSLIPIWFHMSRTEYAVPTFVSFYSAMLYCYWMYRLHNPKYLYPAVIFSMFALYAYSSGQVLVPLTVVALLILDFPYHLRMYRYTLSGAGLGILCAIPYIRFQITYIGDAVQTVSNMGSYWTQNLPLTEKIMNTIERYLLHLSPLYWFTPAYEATTLDGPLYIMRGYSHLGFFLIPFLGWGLWLLIRRIRQTEYRTLLAALLIAPASAALILSPSSITRVMVMVIPAALIAFVGLDDLLQKTANLFKLKHQILVTGLLVVLFSINGYMLWDVLNNGVSWFEKYQLDGIQFGASKVFPAVKQILRTTPDSSAVISPLWMASADLVSRAYLDANDHIKFNSIYDYSQSIVPFNDNTIFVITPQEFDFVKNSPKFSDIQTLKTIPYSASKVGFYIIHLKYSPQAKALMDAEAAALRKPVADEILLDGQKVQVLYTKSDNAVIQVFDNDPNTLYKTAAINPATFDLTFPQEKEFHSIFIIHGAAQIELQVTFLTADGKEIKSYSAKFTENGNKGNTLTLDEPIKASRVNISVKSINENENGTVHIWQILFK